MRYTDFFYMILHISAKIAIPNIYKWLIRAFQRKNTYFFVKII